MRNNVPLVYVQLQIYLPNLHLIIVVMSILFALNAAFEHEAYAYLQLYPLILLTYSMALLCRFAGIQK